MKRLSLDRRGWRLFSETRHHWHKGRKEVKIGTLYKLCEVHPFHEGQSIKRCLSHVLSAVFYDRVNTTVKFRQSGCLAKYSNTAACPLCKGFITPPCVM